VVAEFGQDISGPDSTIDRAKLGRSFFLTGERRNTLNAILHPLIINTIGTDTALAGNLPKHWWLQISAVVDAVCRMSLTRYCGLVPVECSGNGSWRGWIKRRGSSAAD